MKLISLVPVGKIARSQMEILAEGLGPSLQASCSVWAERLDIDFAYDPLRGQYHSTAILQRLERVADPDARVLAVTTLDLYVPVLTFVFGEAQLEGNCAVVSIARLDEQFYGLPHRENLLHERLLKESVHELGHTFGLRHCPDWQCVMASSHGVERLDIKGVDFCKSCRREVFGFYW